MIVFAFIFFQAHTAMPLDPGYIPDGELRAQHIHSLSFCFSTQHHHKLPIYPAHLAALERRALK